MYVHFTCLWFRCHLISPRKRCSSFPQRTCHRSTLLLTHSRTRRQQTLSRWHYRIGPAAVPPLSLSAPSSSPESMVLPISPPVAPVPPVDVVDLTSDNSSYN